MITILPMADDVRKQAILNSFPQIRGAADVIVMCEKEAEFGTAVLSVEGSVLKIYDIAVAGQTPAALDRTSELTADSLLRAAASYGEHHGAGRIEAYLPGLEAFLRRRGFLPAEGCMATPMETIVRRTSPKDAKGHSCNS